MDLSNTNKVKIKNVIIDEYIIKGKTYRDVCKVLGISIEPFHRLLKKYNIPPRKVGKRKKKMKDLRSSGFGDKSEVGNACD